MIGASAIDADGDLLDFDLAEVDVSRAIIRRARRTFVVADASKLIRSAPVRIERDRDALESPTHAGLYPAAEGAGYAGGIVSAALDGLRIAQVLRLERS